MTLMENIMTMDSLSIGVWVTGVMLLLVILGVRVAFAAAIAGFVGLLWIFSARMGFEKGFMVAVNMTGTIPHSKVSTIALSLIPTFILIGYLAYYAGLTHSLFEAAKRWAGCQVGWESPPFFPPPVSPLCPARLWQRRLYSHALPCLKC